MTSAPRPLRPLGLGLGLALAACAARSPSAPRSAAPASAAASASAPEPMPYGGRVVMRPRLDAAAMSYCTGAQLADAERERQSLSAVIEALPEDLSPAGEAGARLVQLLGSPCYAGGALMPGLDLDALRAARRWELKSWWSRDGGTLLGAALQNASALHLVPTVPRALGAETLPAGDPLRAVVCPSSGAECDPLAAGAALDLGREITRFSRPRHDRSGKVSIEECGRRRPDREGDDPWLTYFGCVSQLSPTYTALPLGRYRSPRGWLVLRGRRGHHEFCDESRAYDLATGAAYVASRCSGLVLGARGQVDHGATSQRAGVATQTGVVSVDALRRLALMLHLRGALQPHLQPYEEYPVPETVPLPEPGTGTGAGLTLSGIWAHTGQTDLSFEIIDAGAVLLRGTFVWPDSPEIGDQIVDDLIVSTETTLRPGCPPAPLPDALTRVPPLGGVSRLDATASSLRTSADELSRALLSLPAAPGCRRR